MATTKRSKSAPKIVSIPGRAPEREWIPIDWNKVKTINDLKLIVSNMGLGCYTDSPNYQDLKKYLAPHENREQN